MPTTTNKSMNTTNKSSTKSNTKAKTKSDKQLINEETSKIHYEPDIREIMSNYDPSKNTSSTIMTKFEKTTILGKRATQIAYGADALFDVPPTMYNVVEIAEEELRLKKTPYIVERDLKNGKYEYWKIADMIILD